MAVSKTNLSTAENKRVSDEDINKAISLLEDPQQQHFIQWCISKNPDKRPTARDLLLHGLLYEVPSLKLIAAHAFVTNLDIVSENQLEVQKGRIRNKTEVLFTSKHSELKRGDFPAFDIDKLLEDVKVGIYPLTTFALPKPPQRVRSKSPREAEGKTGGGQHGHGNTPISQEHLETRKILAAQCCFLNREDEENGRHIILQLRLDDKTNRQLRCDTLPEDTSGSLVNELVSINFIRDEEKDLLQAIIEDALLQSNGVASKLTVDEFYQAKLNLRENMNESSVGGNGDFFTKTFNPQTNLESSEITSPADIGDIKTTESSIRQLNINNSNSTPTDTCHISTNDILPPPTYVQSSATSLSAVFSQSTAITDVVSSVTDISPQSLTNIES